MILRAAGDEASAFLGAATFVAYAVTRLWAFSAKGAQLYGRSVEEEQLRAGQPRHPPPFGYSKWAITYYAVTAVMMVLGPMLCAVSFLPAGRTWITPWQATGVWAVGWLLWLPFVWRRLLGVFLLLPIWWFSCIFIGPVLLVLAFAALCFGPSLAFMHLFWEVSAEPTPPGEWLMTQLNPSNAPGDEPVLMHSTLYDDPRAHSVIAHWITAMLAKASATEAV